MQLSSQQIERFYGIWFALLRFVNDQRQLVPAFPALGQEAALPPADEMQLRNALWADETLREYFVAVNSAGLSSHDLAVVDSWRYRLAGGFYIVRALKTSTVFLSDQAYRNAQEREGIITSLVPSAAPSVNEQRTQVEGRNAKLLQAFRKDLIKAGLGLKMVEQHVSTIGAFAHAVLVNQVPPQELLEMTPADLQTYLRAARIKTTATSFKRFVRFLSETGRMEDEQTEALRQVLKQTQV